MCSVVKTVRTELLTTKLLPYIPYLTNKKFEPSFYCFVKLLCAGLDSNQRRINPADLQSALVDHLSTDAYSPYKRTAKLLHIFAIKTSAHAPVFIKLFRMQ